MSAPASTPPVQNKTPLPECAICLEGIHSKDVVKTLPCMHAYHYVCVQTWIDQEKNTCPKCRALINPRLGLPAGNGAAHRAAQNAERAFNGMQAQILQIHGNGIGIRAVQNGPQYLHRNAERDKLNLVFSTVIQDSVSEAEIQAMVDRMAASGNTQIPVEDRDLFVRCPALEKARVFLQFQSMFAEMGKDDLILRQFERSNDQEQTAMLYLMCRRNQNADLRKLMDAVSHSYEIEDPENLRPILEHLGDFPERQRIDFALLRSHVTRALETGDRDALDKVLRLPIDPQAKISLKALIPASSPLNQAEEKL